MARIRTIKPEFFRHEKLQDIESRNPGSYAMLTFAGVWTLCDSKGVFEWKPRQMKLDILPFIDFEIGDTLGLLVQNGFIVRYQVDGKMYGQVTSFNAHQRISGKEAAAGSRYPEWSPEYDMEQPGNAQGSTREASGKHPGSTQENQRETVEQPGKHPGAQERKGKEREKERNNSGENPADAADAANGDKALYSGIQDAFLAHAPDGRFTNYGKEGAAIKQLIQKAKARQPDDPGGFMARILEAFMNLKRKGGNFWAGQPFLPSALNAAGIFDRVLEEARQNDQEDWDALAKEYADEQAAIHGRPAGYLGEVPQPENGHGNLHQAGAGSRIIPGPGLRQAGGNVQGLSRPAAVLCGGPGGAEGNPWFSD